MTRTRPNLRVVSAAPVAPPIPDSIDPTRRGYAVGYHPGSDNFCPGCGRSHWYVGRQSAECAFCGTALALVGAGL